MSLELLLRKIKENPLALLLAIASFALVGYSFSKREQLAQLDKSIIETNERLAVMQSNHLESRSIDVDVKEVQEFAQKIESRLMIRADNALNARYFYTLQDDSGVKIKNINQVQPSVSQSKDELKLFTTTFFSVIDFEVSLTGGMQQIITFLYLLRSGRYFSRVTDLNLTGSSGVDIDTLVLSLKVSVLGRKDVL